MLNSPRFATANGGKWVRGQPLESQLGPRLNDLNALEFRLVPNPPSVFAHGFSMQEVGNPLNGDRIHAMLAHGNVRPRRHLPGLHAGNRGSISVPAPNTRSGHARAGILVVAVSVNSSPRLVSHRNAMCNMPRRRIFGSFGLFVLQARADLQVSKATNL